MRVSALPANAGALLAATAPFVPVVSPPNVATWPVSLLELRPPRPEVPALFLLAAVSLWLAHTGRAQHLWIPALFVAATAGSAWWALRREFAEAVRGMGGTEVPFYAWIHPWPWLLLGPAVMLLGGASWWSYRSARRAEPANLGRVFE